MAIIKIIFRKMLNNRWLTGSLFLGLLITVALVSSIPIYTSGVLQKLLVSELETHHVQEQEYPGEFTFSINFSKDEKINRLTALKDVEVINEDLINGIDLPTIAAGTILSTISQKVRSGEESQTLSARVLSFSNIEDHISITDGKFPSEKVTNNVYEALVPEKALLDRDMVIGTTFTIGKEGSEILIKPVGTFVAKDIHDPYWTMSPDSYSKDFIIAETLFRKDLIKTNEDILDTAKFMTAFDYTTIKNENIPQLLDLEKRVQTEINSLMETILLIDFPMQDILSQYEQSGKQLKTMLWSLNVPVLVMLAIYLYMVSRLIINRQLNEIAVLASRGAKRSQILFIYLIEITILGTIAFIIGPYLGLLLSKLLGATNGFLEFVQRTALPVNIIPESYLYGLLALIASIIMVMVPVYFASNQSIVNHKQSIKNTANKNKWYSILFDVSLVGISLYGLYSFRRRQEELGSQAIQGNDIYIDPILFFLPAIFIIGLGLFILRIYPLLLEGLFKLGEKVWSISLYSTFLQVSRSPKQYKFLMLFLVMTIGIGVYSASAARTINNNLEEQIRYQNGADITLNMRWESSQAVATPSATDNNISEEEVAISEKDVVYTEPSFEPFLNLQDVEQVTKVFKKESVKAESKGKTIFSAELMAIEPKKFGETAWFKSSLLQHHWYNYLNLIAKEPSAVLISKEVSASLDVREGDYLTLQWNGSASAEFVVFGIIEYWPSFNPLEKKEDGSNPSLIVANLSYVQNLMGLEPYEVWLKPRSDNQRNSLYESMRQADIPVTNMKDVKPKLIELKNSAFLLGLNGTLSLGFTISILITFIGFLLYWILTIQSRSLQYGIYRAMGISMRELTGILVWEQIMTSGVACVLGVVIGGITSKLFVPLFQMSFNIQAVVPPFKAMFDSRDEIKIYLFVALMLIVGLTTLVILLRKIKIHQAIKLGED